jgi:hypothetical protein
MLTLVFKPLAMLLPRSIGLSGPSAVRPLRLSYPEPGAISEPYQLELIRSYASAAVTAVVTINSGALIGGLSQAANLDFVPPAALALALFIWALGVTAGVGAWGAAFHSVVAQVAADHEGQLRWTRIATSLFHLSLVMFLLGFIAIGFSALM